MVTFHISYTTRINPSGAAPILNQTQLWAGLQRKVRFAEEFVPVIESCKVLEDKDGVVKRDVVFKKGAAATDRAREVVRSYWPSWIDFEQEDGSLIRNIVSDGPSGGLEDLHMTYTFEFRFPKIQEGSPEAEKELERLKAMSKKSVESTIEAIRKMVVEGRIPE